MTDYNHANAALDVIERRLALHEAQGWDFDLRLPPKEVRAVIQRLGSLENIGRRLLAGYAVEEEEHGFPFNFDLRDAHRELRAALEPK